VAWACNYDEGDKECIQNFGWESFWRPRMKWEDNISMDLMERV
jgi:hypothetical protein